MRISVPAALALGGSLALGALLAPASHATEAGRQCQSLGVANLYGEFVEGDDTHTPDAEGAVAIGGNADFTGGFTVGQELTAEQVAALPGGNALVVAGNLTGTNTQVMKGNGIYGGTLTGVADAHQGKVVKGASPIDFAAEFGKLRAASTALAAAPATTGAKAESSGTRLTLTGTDAQLNTFTVAAATLQAAKEVYLNVPAGASTVVNVTGDSYDMAAAGTTGFFLRDAAKKAYVLDDKLQSAAGGAVRAKLLWNFPTATRVVKNSAAAWSGSVLAPNAAFDLGSGGPVNGSVIAKSLTGKGGAETHHYPFTGCLPAEVPPVVVPTTPGVPTGSASAPATPGTPGTPAGTSPAATPGTGGTPAPSPSVSGSAPATPGAVPSPSASPSATPSTGGGLALTGAGGTLPIAIGGLVVLAAGGGIVVAGRRRAAGRS